VFYLASTFLRRAVPIMLNHGWSLRVALAILRRVAPSAASCDPLESVEPVSPQDAGPRMRKSAEQQVPILRGALACIQLLLGLPCFRVSLTDTTAGRRIDAHLRRRTWGIPHTRIAQAIFELPHSEGGHLRGRSRQAVRTNRRRALASGIVCLQLIDGDVRRCAVQALSERLEHMCGWPMERFCEPGDIWWAAFDATGVPVAVAALTVDREWALWQVMGSTDRSARYLLHSEIVETLRRSGVRYLTVSGPMAPMLESSLQYWQQRLGYSVANLTLPSRRRVLRPIFEARLRGCA
jgi:hypothetical protein